MVWLALVNNVVAALDLVPWTVTINWWWIVAGFLVFITPLGRMGIAVVFARMLLSGLEPGTYRRGGPVHLRVWIAERLAEASGAENLAGAPWLVYYARALGNKVGKGVDLHSAPPVTGMLTLGHRSSIEPEVDLTGHWIDGDLFHVGPITVGNDATIGARSTLLPGAVVGKNADVAPGSGVVGKVKNGQYWKGSPAVKSGKARHPWPDHRPGRAPLWVAVYGVTSVLLGALPLVALAAGLAVIGWGIRDANSLTEAIAPAALWTPVATLAALVTYAVLTVIGVRLLSLRLREGYHPVRSRIGWQLWATERLMDAARNYLFPLYASLLTPWWLRALGAKVGRGTEISTALLTPKFTVIEDGAFLADDTMVASYELGGGWIHVAKATIGKRAFLGNSGITQPGRRVPDDGLVAVLSAAPHKAKAGSSWLGSPPVRLRRKPTAADALRTFHPSLRLKIMRGTVETCRLIPVMVTFAIGVAVLGALQWLAIRIRLPVDCVGRRRGVVDRRCGRRRHRGDREMAYRRAYPGHRTSAVVVVRVAQRGVGHLRRDGRRTLVRPRRQRHTGDESVAAGIGRVDRPRRLVRNILAARGRPGHAGEGRHRQPRLRRADAPVPRPDHADGHRCAGRGFDVGPALCGAARGPARRRRHRRPGLAGDAGRRGAAVDALAGQSDRAVERVPQEAR